ncbi:MAG: PA2779 family protein [Elusimicrobia bacterium]|nr:PA2779 family protein [Elusimicrobiota bacterium]
MALQARSRTCVVGSLCCLIVVSAVMIGAPPPAMGLIVPSSMAEESSAKSSRERDLKDVQRALESKIIRERLKDLGMNEQEIDARLGRLSDKELHQLAVQVRSLAPGGELLEGVLILVVLVLLILFLIKRI